MVPQPTDQETGRQAVSINNEPFLKKSDVTDALYEYRRTHLIVLGRLLTEFKATKDSGDYQGARLYVNRVQDAVSHLRTVDAAIRANYNDHLMEGVR